MTHCNKIKYHFLLNELLKKATQQSAAALVLSGFVRMNLGHSGGTVKCSRSSPTARIVFSIVFVGISKSVKRWADVRRKKKSLAHVLEQRLMLSPLGSATLLLPNPGGPRFFF